MKVDNAVIMAAGTSSRFAPLSYERHKALTLVRGEVLIERQIEQLLNAGIPEIYLVVGYKAEQFQYLIKKYGVKLVYNPEYLERNNNSSIWAVKDILGNSYVCSSDNYFAENPFETEVDYAYYAAVYAEGPTAEWCMTEDKDGFIDSVRIGGENAWYMLGHTFWSKEFADQFLSILEAEYDLDKTRDKLWESIFMEHLEVLKMKIRKYVPGVIHEFDTLDELREFDPSYRDDTRSTVLKMISTRLEVKEREITNIYPLKGTGTEAEGFLFDTPSGQYFYLYRTEMVKKND